MLIHHRVHKRTTTTAAIEDPFLRVLPMHTRLEAAAPGTTTELADPANNAAAMAIATDVAAAACITVTASLLLLVLTGAGQCCCFSESLGCSGGGCGYRCSGLPDYSCGGSSDGVAVAVSVTVTAVNVSLVIPVPTAIHNYCTTKAHASTETHVVTVHAREDYSVAARKLLLLSPLVLARLCLELPLVEVPHPKCRVGDRERQIQPEQRETAEQVGACADRPRIIPTVHQLCLLVVVVADTDERQHAHDE